VIDLHTHSTVSDGTEAPGRIPELAAAAGCSAVALTDHDRLDGLVDAQRSAEAAGVRLVRGCEVSCRTPEAWVTEGADRSMHVLVYFVDTDDGPLAEELARLQADRQARNHALVARLAELGIPVDYDALVEENGGEQGLGRPHFARALVRAGAAEDVDDAFERWLGSGRPAHVPKSRLDPLELCRVAAADGAVTVLAHPLSLGLSEPQLETLVHTLAEGGFAGVEAHYANYLPTQRRMLAAAARRSDLVATGGSDFHGSFKPDLAVGRGLGDLDVPDAALDALEARRP
jgi:predicted metal-dependent phosphoesterase TrpH